MTHQTEELDDVYESLRKLSGSELYSTVFELSASDIRKYCIAVRISRPEHLDRDAARLAGYRDMIAPPSIFSALTMTRLFDKAQLQEDGVAAYLPLGSLFSVVGDSEFEFHDFAYLGETLTLRRTVGDVQLKVGRTGRMIIISHEAVFTGPNAELKAVYKFKQISR